MHLQNLKNLLFRAKEGNSDAVYKIIKLFDVMVNKYSYTSGRLDEDLHSELIISFIKCIKKFSVDETAFLKYFDGYQHSTTNNAQRSSNSRNLS